MDDLLLNVIGEIRKRQEVLVRNLAGGGARDWTSYRELVTRNRVYEEIIEDIKEAGSRQYQEEESSGTLLTIPGASQEVDTE